MLLITCSMWQKAVFITNNFVQTVTLLKCIQNMTVLNLNWKWGSLWFYPVPQCNFCEAAYIITQLFSSIPIQFIIHWSLYHLKLYSLSYFYIHPIHHSMNNVTMYHMTLYGPSYWQHFKKILTGLSPGHTTQLTYLSNLWTFNTYTIQTSRHSLPLQLQLKDTRCLCGNSLGALITSTVTTKGHSLPLW